MFTFYDLEVFKHDWLGVFERDGDIIRIHNDRGALERLLSQTQILVGYNNYGYDDKVLASILRKLNPYDVSQKIISGKSLVLAVFLKPTHKLLKQISSFLKILKKAITRSCRRQQTNSPLFS